MSITKPSHLSCVTDSVLRVNTFETIRKRRSIGKLIDPAPSPNELQMMLEAAVLAPDHKELQPWRFFVIESHVKNELSEHLVEALLHRDPEATQGQIDKERFKLNRAPLIVVVATKNLETKLSFVELLSATAAATQNLLLAATDLGYGSIWRTGDIVRDDNVKRFFALDPQDEIIGFIYIGSIPPDTRLDPKEPRLDGVVTSLLTSTDLTSTDLTSAAIAALISSATTAKAGRTLAPLMNQQPSLNP